MSGSAVQQSEFKVSAQYFEQIRFDNKFQYSLLPPTLYFASAQRFERVLYIHV